MKKNINGIFDSLSEKMPAFLSAVVIAFLVHCYKFTNNFPFFDSFYNFYSSQDMVASGRWFLSAACALSSYFDLPWLIGVFSVFFMAITAAVIADIFEIKNKYLMVLSSGLLVSFPAITETMFFAYTADGYMLAMLLAALCVWFSRMECMGKWKYTAAAVLCLCLACGIYQCYVAFAFILAICYFIGKLLDGSCETRVHVKWILHQAVVYLLGLAGYYVIWKLLLQGKGIDAASYQGISGTGGSLLENGILAAKNCIVSFVFFLLERNPLAQGWTVYSALSCLTAAVFVCLVCFGAGKGKVYKRPVDLLLLFLCLAVIPFGCYLCYFINPQLAYYTRMVQCIAVLFIFTGVLCARWVQGRGKYLIFALLTAVILNHTVIANVCYTYLDRSYEKSYSTMNEIAGRIHLEDDGTAKYIAFVGSFDVISEDADIDNSQLGTLGPLKIVSKAPVFYHDHMILFLSQYTDFTLSYYRTHQEPFPLVPISDNAPVPKGYTFRFPLADEQTQNALLSSEEVAQMGIWPAKDSVKLIDETIVVKLSQKAAW